jgi:diguanylate cyclase (GGDEF)-like protein/PAS domain S-box-containing protein/putative nucleotidyltransferase with HDIG domain
MVALLLLGFSAGLNFMNYKKKKELEFKNSCLRKLFESSQDGILILDNEDRILSSNDSFKRILQYEEKEILGLCCNDILATPETPDAYEISEEIMKGNSVEREVKRRRKDGKLIDVSLQAFPVLFGGEKRGLCAIYRDITSLKEADKEIELQKSYFSQLFENSPEALCILDTEDRFLGVNKAFERLFGFDREEIMNKALNEVIVQEEYRDEASGISRAVLGGRVVKHETFRRKKDGSPIEVCIMGYPITNGQRQIGVYGMYEDITERRRLEKELEYFSYHDQLTGVFNRRYMEEELRRAELEKCLPLSIIVADVNGLKLLNDSLGHVMGDQLLVKVAKVIKDGCRTQDVIARMGGDEFIVLMPGAGHEEAKQVVSRIRQAAAKEMVSSIEISVSLGWATKNSGSEDIMTVLKSAEDHMYRKKLTESPGMRGKAINVIIKTLNEKNRREEQHSQRVSEICRNMGEVIGLTEEEVSELHTIGLLHDIGKIAVEENILNKTEELDESEWSVMRRHPEVGYRILNTVEEMSEIAKFVLYHHERWDGSGYPKGLRGAQIPLQSRILSIADSYDAMTSVRTYGSALSPQSAAAQLLSNAGSQFDPELARVFVEKVLKN